MKNKLFKLLTINALAISIMFYGCNESLEDLPGQDDTLSSVSLENLPESLLESISDEHGLDENARMDLLSEIDRIVEEYDGSDNLILDVECTRDSLLKSGTVKNNIRSVYVPGKLPSPKTEDPLKYSQKYHDVMLENVTDRAKEIYRIIVSAEVIKLIFNIGTGSHLPNLERLLKQELQYRILRLKSDARHNLSDKNRNFRFGVTFSPKSGKEFCHHCIIGISDKFVFYSLKDKTYELKVKLPQKSRHHITHMFIKRGLDEFYHIKSSNWHLRHCSPYKLESNWSGTKITLKGGTCAVN